MIAGLARASVPLEKEWVRSFMFSENSTDVASLLSHLTSPESVENAMLLNGRWDSFGAATSCPFVEFVNFLLVPSITIGGDSVGVVLTRESQLLSLLDDSSSSSNTTDDEAATRAVSVGLNPDLLHLHLQGRFYFSNETGDLLIVQELMPREHDSCFEIVYSMSAVLGSPLPQDSPLRARTVLRMTWMPGARNQDGEPFVGGRSVSEKLTMHVDKREYLAGKCASSIICARYASDATRMICAKCARNKAHSAKMCRCRGKLESPKTMLDHATAARNINLAHRGHWLGDSDVFCSIPGISGPAMTFKQKLSVDVSLTDGSNELCTQLKMLAIDRSMSALSIPKQTMPPAADAVAFSNGFVLPEVVEPPTFDMVDAYLCDSQEGVPEEPALSLQISGDLGMPECIAGTIPTDPSGRGESELFGVPLETDAIHEHPGLPNDGATIVGQLLEVENFSLGIQEKGGGPSKTSSLPHDRGTKAGQKLVVQLNENLSERRVVSGTCTKSQTADGVEELTPEEARERNRRKRAEDRVRSNREAARRSNERRRVQNLELKAALKASRRRAVELGTLEIDLKAENILLRTQYEKQRQVRKENLSKA